MQASASKKIITPEENVYLAGLKSNRMSTGVHDDLYAYSLALKHNQELVVLVALDLIGLFWDDVERIRQKVVKEVGVPSGTIAPLKPENIIIACTHQHSGPDTIGLWGPSDDLSGVSKKYMAYLREQVVSSINSAVNSLKEAKIGFSTTSAPGISVNIRDEKIIDNEIGVMKVEDVKGETIAVMINYASHPEVLWSENTLLTSDFPYYLRQKVEQEPGGMTLYFNSAQGCMITPKVEAHTFKEAERIGLSLAEKVLESLNSANSSNSTNSMNSMNSSNSILLKKEVIEIPWENPIFEVPLIEGEFKVIERELYSGKVRTEVSALTIGDAQMVTIPGEASPTIGLRLKSKMKRPYKFVLGLGNDEVGYILPADDFNKEIYKYEISRSVGPKTAPIIEGKLMQLMEAGPRSVNRKE